MKKTKVIEFTTAMVDGGAETLVASYVGSMNQDEFNPVVLTLYPVKDTANARRVQDRGVKCISIFHSHALVSRAFRLLFGELYIPFKLKKIIKDEKPDCIHAHLQVLKYLDRCSSCLNGVKLLYTCHSKPEFMLEKGSREFKAAKNLIKHNNLMIISLHEEMSKQIYDILNTKSCIIKNGIDIDKYRNNVISKEQIREKIGIPQNAFVIGHIGRFVDSKNHLFLIEVFREIERINSDAFLLLIGSGPNEEKIRNKIDEYGLASKTLFLSHRNDIPDLLRAMNVFVFPSFYEGLSVTLVEVQAAGIRCVISDTVNDESVLSPHTVKMSINLSPNEWSSAILNESIVNDDYGDIMKFDLKETLTALESLYKGK